MQTLLIVILNI